MEVKIDVHTLIIKDVDTEEEYEVRTLRNAQDIAGFLEESEKDEIVSKLEELVSEALTKIRQ